MYRIKVHKRINQIVKFFQNFGIWVEDGAPISSKVIVILQFLSFVSFPVALLSGAIKNDNKLEAVFLASGGFVVFIQTVRLVYIICRKSEILDFLHQFSSHVIEDHEEFVRVNKKLNNLIKIAKFIALDIAFTIIGVFIYHAAADAKTLPFNIGFPLDWKNSEFGYWTAFAYLLIECFHALALLSLNTIIWYIMLSFAIEYELLGNHFRRMGSGIIKRSKISKMEKQILFTQEFMTEIHFHRKIRQRIDQFQSCFSKLFFVQIATGGISICTAVYTLVFMSKEDLSQSPVHVMILLYDIFDIFMITNIANEIKIQSERLPYSLFESHWVEQSNSCKKLIIILTEILKQPHELIIAKLYPLNLETFTAILNFSYTMFNVLRNFN